MQSVETALNLSRLMGGEYSELTPHEKRNSPVRQLHTGIIVSEKGRKLGKCTDTASTLMARDYKGFGNQEMTGVIEWK